MHIELLWFKGCPHHRMARTMIAEVLDALETDAVVETLEVGDEEHGRAVCFPGSPTIRVNGRDIEPGWEPCSDCTPRCRVYTRPDGVSGIPDRTWLVEAVQQST